MAATPEHPLLSKWPRLARRLSLVALGEWPTPVEPLSGLDGVADERVWIKREDLSSSRYGGNKVRKLELLLAGPKRPILTFGPIGSHHVLSTAIHARAVGRSCSAVLVPQHMTEHHRSVNRLIEAHCDHVARVDRPLDSVRELVTVGLGALGRGNPAGWTLIPPGGSSGRGIAGCVACGLEIAEQVKSKQCPEPKRLYVALGTGGTAAGVALGLAWGGLHTEVVAVAVASPLTGNRVALELLARRSLAYLAGVGASISLPELRLRVDPSYIGDGYAHPAPWARRAVAEAAGAGIALETTYTGKAFAALLSDARSVAGAEPVMLLDTYGPIDHLEPVVHVSKENPVC